VLCTAGADVVVTGRRRDSLDALGEQIGASIVAADLATAAGRVAVIDMCRLAAPMLFRSEHASVINVASIFGPVGSLGAMAAYSASKGGVVNFTRHLAAQWGPRAVRVNALARGYFPTELTGGLVDPGLVATITERTLLGRKPRLDELDGSLLYLASDASSYTTGHVLTVDGGWTAG